MTNLYFPCAGLLIAILINALFIFKKNIQNYETKIFKKVIILNLLESLIACIIILLAYNNVNLNILKILNRFDYIIILLWVWNLFKYIYSIARQGVIKNTILYKFTIVFNIIVSFLIVFANLSLINSGDTMNSFGLPVNSLYLSCSFYIILMLYIIAFKSKSFANVKNTPIYILILLCVAMLFIRQIYPDLLLLSFAISFISLLMYHTIENPDGKMLDELKTAKDYAEKANRAKSDFLSSMSHEIRTPLNAIVGLSEDMKDRDICPESMKEDLNDVVYASQTLLEIVGNIMDINKIECDKVKIIDVPYNFKKEIQNLANIQETRIGEKKIAFKIDIAEDIPYELIGDKIHIKQIINNLLSNAIKYTHEGFVEFSVKCINKDKTSLLIISVKDSGKGINEDNLSKLFTKFERLDIERNTTVEGTGLGLAITKRLVDLMGGKINVNSEFGVGSLFVVEISQKISKLYESENSDLLKHIDSNLNNIKIDYSSKKILIVDDNKLNIKVAKRALANLNLERIDECFNGHECVELIRSGNQYDIILMDIMMPIMNGKQAISELRLIDNFNTPVVALTADAIAGVEEKYKKEGFTDYIAKPFSKDEIKEKLDYIFIKKES